MVALLGLRQASAPARLRHPPLSDDAVLPVPGSDLNTGNTHGIARAPAPLGAGMAQRGGKTDYPVWTFSRPTPIRPKIFPAIFISVRKNTDVQTFVRNFFGFFRFQTGKSTAVKISVQHFLRFSTFAAKFFRQKKFRGQKKYGFPDSMACIPENGLRRRVELVVEPTPLFPTFVPTFFSFFNFRPENFPVFQISSRKKSGSQTFNPKIFAQKKFQIVQVGRDRPDPSWEICITFVVKLVTMGSYPSIRGEFF